MTPVNLVSIGFSSGMLGSQLRRYKVDFMLQQFEWLVACVLPHCAVTPSLMKKNSNFWQSIRHDDRLVNTEHVYDRRLHLRSISLPCLVHTVNCFTIKNVWPGDNFNENCKSDGKEHTAFKWKYAISMFPDFQDSAEVLNMWGETIKHVTIA